MKYIFSLLLLSALIIPFFPVRASTVDLGFRNKNAIFFSTNNLVAGDKIRVYAQVTNFGDVDVEGYVSFNQGTIPIGDSQVVSVRAGGEQDEVYVDFVVPESSFNIRAEIKGTDPEDTSSSNDVIISELFVPILDDDHDGIENSSDNCISVNNSSQADTDGDSIGDACDDDDDNDGLSDDVEKEIGTDPTKKDSDADGVIDPDDYAPMDPSISVETVIAAPAVAEVVEVYEVTDTTTVSESPEASESQVNELDESSTKASVSSLQVSPKAMFAFERVNWNTFTFYSTGTSDSLWRYKWDFGDGVSSSKETVEHTYRGFGDYLVTFSVTDEDGVVSSDELTVSVSFFNVENPYLKILIGVLAVLFITSFGLFVKSIKAGKRYVEDSTE